MSDNQISATVAPFSIFSYFEKRSTVGKANRKSGKMGMKYLPLRFSMNGAPTGFQIAYIAAATLKVIKIPMEKMPIRGKILRGSFVRWLCDDERFCGEMADRKCVV